jgi:hypothetical protein
MSTTTLYALGAEWLELDQLLAETEGELTPELQARLEAFSLAERAKVDGYVQYLRGLKAQAEALKAEAKVLSEKAKRKETVVAALMERVAQHMTLTGVTVLPGDIWEFRRVGTGGKAPLIVDEQKALSLPFRFFRTQEPVLDREALRAGVEAKDPWALDVASIGERGSYLKIV